MVEKFKNRRAFKIEVVKRELGVELLENKQIFDHFRQVLPLETILQQLAKDLKEVTG